MKTAFLASLKVSMTTLFILAFLYGASIAYIHSINLGISLGAWIQKQEHKH